MSENSCVDCREENKAQPRRCSHCGSWKSKWLIESIVDLFLVGVGDTALFVVTLGRHRPRWRRLGDASVWSALFELSFWIGVGVWIATSLLVSQAMGSQLHRSSGAVTERQTNEHQEVSIMARDYLNYCVTHLKYSIITSLYGTHRP